MTTSLRGTCPVCDQSTAVRQDGNLRAHGASRRYGRPPCAGSFKPPKEDTSRA